MVGSNLEKIILILQLNTRPGQARILLSFFVRSGDRVQMESVLKSFVITLKVM